MGLDWGEVVGIYKLDLSRLALITGWKSCGFGKHGRVVVEEMPRLKGSLETVQGGCLGSGWLDNDGRGGWVWEVFVNRLEQWREGGFKIFHGEMYVK